MSSITQTEFNAQIIGILLACTSFVCRLYAVNLFVPEYNIHTYQILPCATAINTKFSKLFSPKRVYVKYKNAILTHKVAPFALENIRYMACTFPEISLLRRNT